MFTKKRFTLISLLVVLALILVACGGNSGNTANNGGNETANNGGEETTNNGGEEAAEPTEEMAEPTEEPAEMPEVDFAVMPGGALEEALKGTYEGTTVTVDGAFEGNDPDGVKFDRSMEAFEAATGITVNYIGNKEYRNC